MSTTQVASTPELGVDAKGFAWITFDDPDRSLNVLTEEVLRTLDARLDEVAEGATHGRIRGLVIISGKRDSFIAGADVEAIAGVESPADGQLAAKTGQRIFQ